MHPPTHLAVSWLVGHRLSERRDRVLVAWSGMAPDVDGLTLLAGVEHYARWHHVLTHGVAFAVVVAAGCAALARERWQVAALALVAFHLHLACDLLGSGVEWKIAYLAPFDPVRIATPYGWPLDSWQNATAAAFALAACAWVGVRRGRTLLEACLPAAADRAVVAALCRRLGRRPTAVAAEAAPLQNVPRTERGGSR